MLAVRSQLFREVWRKGDYRHRNRPSRLSGPMARFPRLLNPDEYKNLGAEEKLQYLRAMMDGLRSGTIKSGHGAPIERRGPRKAPSSSRNKDKKAL